MGMWEGEVGWGLVGTGPRFETQVDGKLNRMEGFRVEGLSLYSCRLWHGSRGVILKNRKNLNKLLVFEALYL